MLLLVSMVYSDRDKERAANHEHRGGKRVEIPLGLGHCMLLARCNSRSSSIGNTHQNGCRFRAHTARCRASYVWFRVREDVGHLALG